MENVGRGEIHFTNNEGVKQVEIIPLFQLVERHLCEAVTDYKERVTAHVLKHGRLYKSGELVEVKWSADLGYHQGYIEPLAPSLIKHC